jgi:AraC-like DNA-binding protein
MPIINNIQASVFPLSKARPIYTALNIINEDVSNHIKLKQLARQSGTNECTLKKGFRILFNISVYQYLLQSRMAKATTLLQNPKLKHKDIADQCGYESLAGFVTAFRKYYGQTPGEHRKQYQSVDNN